MDPEEKAAELTEKPTESKGPKGDADAPGTSPVKKNEEVVLSTTPEDLPQASGEHVSLAHPL